MTPLRPSTPAVFALLVLAVYTTSAFQNQPDNAVPRDILLLTQIRLKMARNLSRIPNYTCLETISRGSRAPDRFVVAVPGKQVPFRRLDVLRLEVAEVNGDELYAFAGQHNFEKKDISEFGKGGLIGNGSFSLFAHDVFTTNIPTFQLVGEERMEGRALIRYDFKVAQFLSGYRVWTNFGSAVVGFHGSFWADPQTFDAVRMDIIADDIPPDIGLTSAASRVDYDRVRIGETEALLPQSSSLTTSQVRGGGSRNQIAFTHCREYGVESVIRFDNVTESGESMPGSVGMLGANYVELPSGLPLTLRLETPIDSRSAHIGDPISATVDIDAKAKGVLAVPKDALVTGRLRRLEIHQEGWPYVLAGLEFIEIEFQGKQTRFFAELEKIMLPSGAPGPKRVGSRDLPGVGMVSAMGNNFLLPKGTLMLWKTISYKQAAEIGK